MALCGDLLGLTETVERKREGLGFGGSLERVTRGAETDDDSAWPPRREGAKTLWC